MSYTDNEYKELGILGILLLCGC